ncbi:MAG: hypothetical protein LBN35_04305 [Clostridiales Family XIII bacterium]|nr:hypothetical protein [Clostridiales Family XIII bacterium]
MSTERKRGSDHSKPNRPEQMSGSHNVRAGSAASALAGMVMHMTCMGQDKGGRKKRSGDEKQAKNKRDTPCP